MGVQLSVLGVVPWLCVRHDANKHRASQITHIVQVLVTEAFLPISQMFTSAAYLTLPTCHAISPMVTR